MKRKEVELFEKIQPQMEALYTETGDLAKKKPDVPINKFKLGIINGIIQNATALLGAKYEPMPGFSKFNEDDLPTVSDVVMVCGQYLSCLEKLRSDNIGFYGYEWLWKIDGQYSDIRTRAPRKTLKE